MRGSDAVTGSLFSYVDLEDRVPAKHPLRVIREVVNEVLISLDADFAAMYSDIGRQNDSARAAAARLADPGVLHGPVRASADGAARLQPAVSLVRRARHRRSGVGPLDLLEEPRPPSRGRRRQRSSWPRSWRTGRVAPLLSDDHFTVDGTMVQAWASMKSFLPKDGTGSNAPPPDAGSPPPADEPSAPPPSKTEPDAASPATPIPRPKPHR